MGKSCVLSKRNHCSYYLRAEATAKEPMMQSERTLTTTEHGTHQLLRREWSLTTKSKSTVVTELSASLPSSLTLRFSKILRSFLNFRNFAEEIRSFQKNFNDFAESSRAFRKTQVVFQKDVKKCLENSCNLAKNWSVVVANPLKKPAEHERRIVTGCRTRYLKSSALYNGALI